MILVIDHDAVVERAYKLPPLPQSAARLARILTNEEPDLGEIVRVIEYDPTLTMKVLRVANSAVAAARHRIGTVREALIRLGTGAVAGFATATCVRQLIGTTIPGYNIPVKEFWTHSLAAAFAAESIQAHSPNWSGPLAFTAALLHDIGKLVLGQFLDAEITSWLERAATEGHQAAFKAEGELLSLHHGEAGGIIAQHWGFPEQLVKGIIYHHEPDMGCDGICYVTFLANLVAHRLEAAQRIEGDAPEPWKAEHLSTALTYLGLTEEDLVMVCKDVRHGLQAVSDQII